MSMGEIVVELLLPNLLKLFT